MFDTYVLNQKLRIEDLVARAGGKIKGTGNRFSSNCVLHGGSNPTAFSIYEKDGIQLWHCFTGDCQGGDLIRFVEVWQGLSFRDACIWINGGAIEDAEGMKESAAQRHAAAQVELIAAQEREQARRKELRVAELHLLYHREMTQYHKDEWTKAGIDEGMQGFWTLGGRNDFTYFIGAQEYHTPTLTIPIFNETNELMTIQHKLLNPHDPYDKYRPERKGLHSHPFLAVPAMGFDGDIVWVMEGAKKSMVTWTKGSSYWQCIGVSGQESYKSLIEILKPVGKRVIVVPDPNSARNKNSLKKAYHLAREIKCRFLQVPEKFDDFILVTNANENDLFAMSKQARSV